MHVTGHTERVELNERLIEGRGAIPLTVVTSSRISHKIGINTASALLTPKTVHGRPDVTAILREEIGNALGPVCVDGMLRQCLSLFTNGHRI
jgi:hypothetical protein